MGAFSCEDSEILLISILFISTILGLGSILRRFVRDKIEGPLNCFLLVIVSFMESTAVAWELGVVSDKYGLPLTFFFIFVLQVWWGITRGEVRMSADELLEEVYMDELTLGEAIAVIACQITGGYIGHWVAKLFWMFELTAEHKAKACAKCTAGPKIGMLSGMIIEAVGVGVNKIAGRSCCGNMEPIGAVILKTLVLIYTVLTANDYTGAFFSPSLATSMQFGCEGFRFLDHVVVYWAGPVVGAIGSTYIYEHLLLLK